MSESARREILLVEDSHGDAMLAREAFREAGVDAALSVIADGSEVLPYLRGEGPHAERRLPDLVLLDLKLPGKRGNDLLAAVKRDPELRRIPVVVLTTSTADHDVTAAYDEHANSYIRKPLAFADLVALARLIGDYWLSVVRLPER
jgi:CheY-like chemotaxis protein